MELNKQVCTKCANNLDICFFYKQGGSRKGYRKECKICSAKVHKTKKRIYNSAELYKKHLVWYRTKEGFTARMYNKICFRNKTKRIANAFSLKSFRNWIYEQEEFHNLFEKWVLGGYNLMDRPTCDRLDDYKGYYPSNLQIVTLRKNIANYHCARVEGKNNKLKDYWNKVRKLK